MARAAPIQSRGSSSLTIARGASEKLRTDATARGSPLFV
jgi:hypothetical protein